jgi:hypothetical protein
VRGPILDDDFLGFVLMNLVELVGPDFVDPDRVLADAVGSDFRGTDGIFGNLEAAHSVGGDLRPVRTASPRTYSRPQASLLDAELRRPERAAQGGVSAARSGVT